MNTKNDLPKLLLQITLAALAGGVLFLVGLGILLGSFQGRYEGKIYPGVSVGWVDLSGKTREEAAEILGEEYLYPLTGTITFHDQNQTWETTPSDLGLFFSPDRNADRAFQVGRRGGLYQRWSAIFQAYQQGVTLAPEFFLDESVTHEWLSSLGNQINQPPQEASLQLDGVEVIAQPGQIGRTLQVNATLEVLSDTIRTLHEGDIALIVQEDPPQVLDVQAEAEEARKILDEPLVLQLPDPKNGDPGPWTLSREQLAAMLNIQRVSENGESRYQVTLNEERLQATLDEINEAIAVEPQNARFIFNDDTRQLEVIQQEVIGRDLNITQSITRIRDSLRAGEHNVQLVVETAPPEVTSSATAEELGIRELVNEEVSFFYYSSAERINNIDTAASRFHGVLVAPGETFSMGEILGNVSLEEGYSEAWIIYGNRTIKGVGGGVCQVSTTLFRTVFFAGFPVVERYSHAYRVQYYEQTASGGYNENLAGLDATVYFPLVDFKFKNDTDTWLLMETYVIPQHRTLRWKFYGTDDGRRVEWETTGVRNKTDPPEPLYEENEDLNKGEIKQVDWAVEGGDVTVTREVYRDGQMLWEDVFKTHYQPWQAVCQYGPGTKGMPPKKIDPDNPCKPSK